LEPEADTDVGGVPAPEGVAATLRPAGPGPWPPGIGDGGVGRGMDRACGVSTATVALDVVSGSVMDVDEPDNVCWC
jgi:hypothetical protein